MRIVFVIIFSSLWIGKCYPQSPPCLNTLPAQSAFDCLYDPDEVCVADFNSDGNMDMAVTNYPSDNVAIFLGTGSGSFAAPVYHFYWGFGPRAIVSADFDLDGDKDLAVTTNGFNGFALMLGSPTGTFSAPIPYGGNFPGTTIAASDFNNDGYPDIAVTLPTIDNVRIYINSGSGTFSSGTSYFVGNTPAQVITGNFNSDAWPDLAVANNGSSNVSILLGSSNGVFLSAQNYTVGPGPVDLVAGDFNNDNIPDLAVTGNNIVNTGYVAILPGNGFGGFAAPVSFNLGNYYAQGIIKGDFNNDGNRDIAATALGSVDMTILLGNGNITFGAAKHYMAGASGGINSGDFNNDGNLDIVVPCESANRVDVFKGDGSGNFAAARDYANSATRSGICRDFNNDGYPDVVTTSPNGNNVSLLINNSTGGFLAPTVFTTGLRPEGVASGDFNQDGNADLAVCNYSSNNVSLSLGTGTGTFSPVISFSAGINPYAISLADFNGDLRPDIAVTNINNANVTLLLSNGLLSFLPAISFTTIPQPGSIVTADFNGDNLPDIAIASLNTNSVQVFLTNGPGSFSSSVTYTTGYFPFGISTGDLNNDGKQDLIVAHNSTNIGILTGLASGSFSPVSYVAAFANSVVQCVDMNGDGNKDLVVESYQNLKMLFGNGAASFTNTINWPVSPGSSSADLPVADLNLDGSLDIVRINTTRNITVFLSGFAPNVSITPVPSVICAALQFTLTASGASGYLWNTNATNANYVITPTVTTTYSVTGSSIYGCMGNSAAVTVSVKPSPTISVSSGSICSGKSFTLSPGTVSNYTFQNNGPVVNPSVTTSYTVSVAGTNGCITTRTAQVIVIQNPTVSILSGSICSGQSFTFQPTGANSYTMQGGSFVVSPSVNSTYSVTGSTKGCINTQTAQVLVIQNPTVSILSGTICTGQSFTLLPTGATSYTLQGGSAMVSPTINSTYSVVGSNSSGCLSSVSLASVLVNPLAVISITSASNPICDGQTVSLSAAGGVNYIWNGFPGQAMITVTPNATSTYTVVGEDPVTGCTGTFIFTQVVEACTGIDKNINAVLPEVYPNPDVKRSIFLTAMQTAMM